MNFLSIDGALENIIFFIKIDNKTYSNTFQSNKYNYENLSNLLINFLNRRNVDLNEVENIFVNQGPGNFSGLRTTIAVAKGLYISKKIKSFAHGEFNKADIVSEKNIELKISQGEDVLGRGYKIKKIEIDSSYPEYIINNKDKLKNWIA